MLDPARYRCPWCGEVQEADVDASAGSTQEYVEDCTVCCRPSVLTVRRVGGRLNVAARAESDQL